MRWRERDGVGRRAVVGSPGRRGRKAAICMHARIGRDWPGLATDGPSLPFPGSCPLVHGRAEDSEHVTHVCFCPPVVIHERERCIMSNYLKPCFASTPTSVPLSPSSPSRCSSSASSRSWHMQVPQLPEPHRFTGVTRRARRPASSFCKGLSELRKLHARTTDVSQRRGHCRHHRCRKSSGNE